MPARARTLVASLALGGVVATTVLFALGAAGTPSFFVPASRHEYPDWLAGPLSGLALDWGAIGPLILLGGMFLFYVALVPVADAVAVRPAIWALVGLHLLLFLGPPLLSTDLFGYLAFARLEAVHDLSPYTHAVQEIPNDPINTYLSAVWPTSLSTPYGPLFVLASSALAALGIPIAIWSLKLVAVASALGCVALVGACARELGRPALPAALFVGLNPLWLAWTVGGSHNDLVMALVLMAGVYVVLLGRDRLGAGAIAAASVGVKATAGLALPFLFLAGGRRWEVLGGAVTAAALIALLGLAAMGADFLGYLPALAEQSGHLSNQSVPQAVGHLLGVGGITPGIRLAAGLAFVASTLALMWRAWRTGDWIVPAGWATIALLLTSSSLHPWYIVGLVPLAAVGDSRALRVATLGMSVLLAVVKLTP